MMTEAKLRSAYAQFNAKEDAARALLAALEGLLAASGHMSPFAGEASVKGVRLAGKYMEAHDAALAAIAQAVAAGISPDKAEG